MCVFVENLRISDLHALLTALDPKLLPAHMHGESVYMWEPPLTNWRVYGTGFNHYQWPRTAFAFSRKVWASTARVHIYLLQTLTRLNSEKFFQLQDLIVSELCREPWAVSSQQRRFHKVKEMPLPDLVKDEANHCLLEVPKVRLSVCFRCHSVYISMPD